MLARLFGQESHDQRQLKILNKVRTVSTVGMERPLVPGVGSKGWTESGVSVVDVQGTNLNDDRYVQDLTDLVEILIFVGKTQASRIVRQVDYLGKPWSRALTSKDKGVVEISPVRSGDVVDRSLAIKGERCKHVILEWVEIVAAAIWVFETGNKISFVPVVLHVILIWINVIVG